MSTRQRLLFYSHDSFGLGHFRRSLTIASYLSRHLDNVSILMVTGLDSAAAFETPPGVDFVKLPSIWKAGPDTYRTRHLRVSFARVVRMRERLIRAVAGDFDPHMLVVDNVPRGVDGELLPTLRHLRKHHPATRVVLTLRDVLDAPEPLIAQWTTHAVYSALRRFYDEVWVVGSRAIFDVTQLYRLPASLHSRVRFCGYIVRSSPPEEAANLRQALRLPAAPLVVVSCGGGGDGFPLIDAYASAAPALAQAGVYSAVFLGPDMPPGERRVLKQRLLPLADRVLTFDFHPDLVSFLRLASASVSMAGYNTVCEVVAARIPALVVPRVTPRREQLLRAEAFARHGLLRMLPPEQLAPERLAREVLDLLRASDNASRRPLPAEIDFAGLRRILRRVRRHLGRVDALLPGGQEGR